MKQTILNLLLALCALAGMTNTAKAESKTVTYTIGYTGTNKLTATPNVAGFDGSTEVINGPAISGSSSNFGLFLHDNLQVTVNLYNDSGDHRMKLSSDGITFYFAATIKVTCSSYYITHIAMKEHMARPSRSLTPVYLSRPTSAST